MHCRLGVINSKQYNDITKRLGASLAADETERKRLGQLLAGGTS